MGQGTCTCFQRFLVQNLVVHSETVVQNLVSITRLIVSCLMCMLVDYVHAHVVCMHVHLCMCMSAVCAYGVCAHVCVFWYAEARGEFQICSPPYFFEAGSLAKFGAHCFQLGLLSACSSYHMSLY